MWDQVRWYRDDLMLTTELAVSNSTHHSLVVAGVTRADLATYQCAAFNRHGKARATVQLSGRPSRATILETSRGGVSPKPGEFCIVSLERHSISAVSCRKVLSRWTGGWRPW